MPWRSAHVNPAKLAQTLPPTFALRPHSRCDDSLSPGEVQAFTRFFIPANRPGLSNATGGLPEAGIDPAVLSTQPAKHCFLRDHTHTQGDGLIGSNSFCLLAPLTVSNPAVVTMYSIWSTQAFQNLTKVRLGSLEKIQGCQKSKINDKHVE